MPFVRSVSFHSTMKYKCFDKVTRGCGYAAGNPRTDLYFTALTLCIVSYRWCNGVGYLLNTHTTMADRLCHIFYSTVPVLVCTGTVPILYCTFPCYAPTHLGNSLRRIFDFILFCNPTAIALFNYSGIFFFPLGLLPSLHPHRYRYRYCTALHCTHTNTVLYFIV